MTAMGKLMLACSVRMERIPEHRNGGCRDQGTDCWHSNSEHRATKQFPEITPAMVKQTSHSLGLRQDFGSCYGAKISTSSHFRSARQATCPFRETMTATASSMQRS